MELREIALTDPSFRSWTAASRLLERIRTAGSVQRPPTRVAVIGTSTLDPLAALLPLAGHGADLDLRVVHVGGIGQYETEALDPGSKLYTSDPEVIVLAPDLRATSLSMLPEDGTDEVHSEISRWTSLLSAVRRHTDATVLHLNFVPPVGRVLGALDSAHPSGRRRLIRDLNLGLADALGHDEHLVDVDTLACEFGLRQWHDDRYWFHGKQAMSPSAIPRLAQEIASTIRSARGRARKCLVVDLDNTLWGGVVGDDGVEGLKLAGTAVGEAHLALQDHLVDLRRRGILLAVCSKNDDATARAPFEQRDDMRLRLSDFVAFSASWKPKPEGIRAIADELSIGLDSIVFVDDNVAERAFVRSELPQVDVIHMPADPSGFARTVASYSGFDAVTLSAEDLVRTDQYRARAAAASARDDAASLDEFLLGLEMRCEVRPIDSLTVERAAQLVGKTNQWNLTTRRRTAGDLAAVAAEPSTIALTVRLVDRFVDHGIVGVLIATVENGAVDIDTFLMSCRVIGRSLERSMLDDLVERAERRGVTLIRGQYVPSGRNDVVSDVFSNLGFAPAGESDDGSTTWVLDTGQGRPRPNTFIAKQEASSVR